MTQTRHVTFPAPAPHEPALQHSRAVLYGVLALAAASTAGAAISVAGGLSPTWAEAYGSHGRLSIPLPMMVAQVVVALGTTGRHRVRVLVSSALIAVALLLGVVSGFFDGGYADGRLDALERTYQVGFITGLVVVGSLALRRFVTALRSG